jgi:hypothetical protein
MPKLRETTLEERQAAMRERLRVQHKETLKEMRIRYREYRLSCFPLMRIPHTFFDWRRLDAKGEIL